jgi:hypothetical protein
VLVLLVLATLSTLLGTCVWLGSRPAAPLTPEELCGYGLKSKAWCEERGLTYPSGGYGGLDPPPEPGFPRERCEVDGREGLTEPGGGCVIQE